MTLALQHSGAARALVMVALTTALAGVACEPEPERARASKTKPADPAPVATANDASDGEAEPDEAGDTASPAPATSPEAVPHFTGREAVETTVSGVGEGPYRFTAWWHKSRVEQWEKALARYKGRKALAYLEVGVFEGRSLLWILENVMTDPTSTATAVDIFMEEYEATFDANIAASGASSRIKKIKEPSQTALRRLALDSFDVIYIDGSHTADDVLADAVLSWDLLREGGLIIFDDYQWVGRPHGGALPPELLPKLAIDAFVTAHRYELELVEKGAQVMLRKLPNPCATKDYCSPVGQYLYFWRELLLRDAAGKTIPLTTDEIALIETIAKARREGEVDVRLDRKLRESEAFKQLDAKLDLDLSRRRAPDTSPR